MPGAYLNPSYRAPAIAPLPAGDPSNDEQNMTGEELDARDKFWRHMQNETDQSEQKQARTKTPDLDVLPQDVAPSPYGDAYNP